MTRYTIQRDCRVMQKTHNIWWQIHIRHGIYCGPAVISRHPPLKQSFSNEASDWILKTSVFELSLPSSKENGSYIFHFKLYRRYRLFFYNIPFLQFYINIFTDFSQFHSYYVLFCIGLKTKARDLYRSPASLF